VLRGGDSRPIFGWIMGIAVSTLDPSAELERLTHGPGKVGAGLSVQGAFPMSGPHIGVAAGLSVSAMLEP
jgi:hypothetical protein